MRMLTKPDLGRWVGRVVSKSTKVTIASAYVQVDPELQQTLEGAGEVEFIVSAEFTINNPEALRRMSRTSGISVRFVEPEHEDGRLHAKVIIARVGDCTRALVGSANFTHQGIFQNREVCLAADSQSSKDRQVIEDLEQWLDQLRVTAVEPDESYWESAIGIWRRRPAQTRMFRAPRMQRASVQENIWLLKTTRGPTGPSHWPQFQEEGVVAIGWQELQQDPSQLSDEQLHEQLQRVFRGVRQPVCHIVRQIRDFQQRWQDGDLAIICRGWAPNQSKPVLLYGFAREGRFQFDYPSWCHMKREAVLQSVEARIPVRVFSQTLGMGSARQTIHVVDRDKGKALLAKLESEYGIPLRV